jgi:hypothetical protein
MFRYRLLLTFFKVLTPVRTLTGVVEVVVMLVVVVLVLVRVLVVVVVTVVVTVPSERKPGVCT